MKNLKEVQRDMFKFLNMFEQNINSENLVQSEINENSNDVLTFIQSDNYESNATEFKKSLNQSKHKEMLTNYSIPELKKMKLFKVPGYNIGFALKQKDGKFQEIVAVHNNEPNIKGVGQDLVKSAIGLGGIYLDHFDGVLTKFYSDLGFVEYDRDAYDPQYDKGGKFRKKYGEMSIIYRKLKGS